VRFNAFWLFHDDKGNAVLPSKETNFKLIPPQQTTKGLKENLMKATNFIKAFLAANAFLSPVIASGIN
jgi:hypothetical protein